MLHTSQMAASKIFKRRLIIMTDNSSDFVESYNWTFITQKVVEIKQTTVLHAAKQYCQMHFDSF